MNWNYYLVAGNTKLDHCTNVGILDYGLLTVKTESGTRIWTVTNLRRHTSIKIVTSNPVLNTASNYYTKPQYVCSCEAWLSKLGYTLNCSECRWRTLNRQEQLRHRAVCLFSCSKCYHYVDIALRAVVIQAAALAVFGGFANRDYGASAFVHPTDTYLAWSYWMAVIGGCLTLVSGVLFLLLDCVTDIDK